MSEYRAVDEVFATVMCTDYDYTIERLVKALSTNNLKLVIKWKRQLAYLQEELFIYHLGCRIPIRLVEKVELGREIHNYAAEYVEAKAEYTRIKETLKQGEY